MTEFKISKGAQIVTAYLGYKFSLLLSTVASSVEDSLRSRRFVVEWTGSKNDDVGKAAMAIASTWEDLARLDEEHQSRSIYRTPAGRMANIIAFKVGRTTAFLFVVKIRNQWAFQGCSGSVEPLSEDTSGEKQLWEHVEDRDDLGSYRNISVRYKGSLANLLTEDPPLLELVEVRVSDADDNSTPTSRA